MLKHKQAGLAVAILPFVILILGMIGFVGYRVLDTPTGSSDKQNPQNTQIYTEETPVSNTELLGSSLIGIVQARYSCRYGEGVHPCFDYILQSENGTMYGLRGEKLDLYVNKKVTLTGEIDKTTNPPTFTVATIKSVDSLVIPSIDAKLVIFDAQRFYNEVKEGMTNDEVKELAGGKLGDCAQTAVYPPSGNVSCTWSNTELRVTVNFTWDKVVSKQKKSL